MDAPQRPDSLPCPHGDWQAQGTTPRALPPGQPLGFLDPCYISPTNTSPSEESGLWGEGGDHTTKEGKPLSEKEDSNWSLKCCRKIIFPVPLAQTATNHRPPPAPTINPHRPFPSQPRTLPCPKQADSYGFYHSIKKWVLRGPSNSLQDVGKGILGLLCWFSETDLWWGGGQS